MLTLSQQKNKSLHRTLIENKIGPRMRYRTKMQYARTQEELYQEQSWLLNDTNIMERAANVTFIPGYLFESEFNAQAAGSFSRLLLHAKY